MKSLFGRATAIVLFVAAVAVGISLAGGASVLHKSAAPARYTATPDGESDSVGLLESYWSDRVTYPTGHYNPAWLRRAAAQDERIESATPEGTYPSGQTVEASSLPQRNVVLNTTNAIPLGPAPERMTGCGGCFDYTRTAGRINAIVVDPTTTTNGSIVAYAASVGGGVWKTTNCCSGTTTWSVTTDDPLIATISIDTLAMDPNDHNIVYAGTGDLNYGSFSMGSQGILKTTDGGAHWTMLGASVFGPAYSEPAGQFPQYDAVGKVRVDPNNSNIVAAGTKKGLCFSYDGGTNWTGPCTTNSFTSMRQDITGLELSNMGGGVTRILAAVGVRGFATTVQYDLDQNGANGVYSATMPASGCPTFTLISRDDNGFVFGTQVTGSPYGTGAQMHAGSGTAYVSTSRTSTVGNQLGRIDIAVAPSQPERDLRAGPVDRSAEQLRRQRGCGNANGCQLGAWATTDGGATWIVHGRLGRRLAQGVRAPAQARRRRPPATIRRTGTTRASRSIRTTPTASSSTRSTSGSRRAPGRPGTTRLAATRGVSPKPVHVDQHALAFVPGSSSMLLAGNDGGVHGTLERGRRSAEHASADVVQHGHRLQHDRVLLRRHQRQLRHLGEPVGGRRRAGQRAECRHVLEESDHGSDIPSAQWQMRHRR